MRTKITKSDGWRLFVRTVIGRAYPRVVGTTRDLNWLFFDIFFPFLTTVGYVYTYRALQAPSEYVGFVVLGGAMSAFWFNVLWSMASQLYWEKETGNLSLYIVAPTSLMAILLGMALGGLLSTAVRAVVILLLGSWMFQVQYAVVSFWALFVVFMLTMAALYGMGMMMSSLFLFFNREAWHIANLIEPPVMLFSGFYFPLKAFGFWPAIVASLIPLTMGMDAMRQLAFPSGAALGLLPVRTEIIVLIVLTVVYIGAARFVLAYMEKLAIRQGKISDRLS
ncbi:MAG: ABC transporter permease [Anaerolineaceae bacterium]